MKQLVVLLFVFLGLSVSAQNDLTNSDSIKSREIKEINVYSFKKDIEIGLLALPVTTVSKTVLANPSFFTPADALSQKAGISLSRDGVWATSVNVRGLSKERLLILADGERIQTATDISAALSTIDMNSLERIEVVKGAASVLYGTGAMGGVINFVTERPTYTEKIESKGKVGSGFNSVNNLWANNARVQVTNYNWYLAANGSYRKADNIKTPQGELKNSQFNDASFGFQGGLVYDESQELLVNYQHTEAWNVGLPGGDAFPVNAKVTYRNVTRNQLSGEYVFNNPAEFLKEMRLKAYTQNITRNVDNVVSEKVSIFPSSRNVTSGAKLLTDWDLDSPFHTLSVGAEVWVRDAKTQRYREMKNSETKFTVTGEQPVPNAKMSDFGVFAQYSWKIHPRKLRMDVGTRLDYVRTQNDTAFNPVFQYIVENGERTDVELSNRKVLFQPGTQNEFSYSAHVDFVYTPAKSHKIALSLSNAYRVASLEERFKFIDLGNTVRMGDPKLKPEKGFFSNLNYTFKKERLQIKTDIFANYLFGLITEKKIAGIGVDTLMNVNIDNAMLFGAEIELDYFFAKNFWLTANASYTNARDVKNNQFLPQIPPLKGMVELNYRYRDLFVASVNTMWAARQANVAPGENTTDGHAILNAAIRSERIKLNKVYLQLFAGVDNILDTEYYNHLSTTRGLLRLEPGRNIYAKLQLGW